MSALHFPETPLLACPFCGMPARWFRTGRNVGVECTATDMGGCPGCAQTDVYDPLHANDAAHQWNRRPDSHEGASVAEMLRALRSMVGYAERYAEPCLSGMGERYDVLKREMLLARAALAKATGDAA